MEDALVRFLEESKLKRRLVLILVVMEDALVPLVERMFGSWTYVLILVVMEDALVHQNLGYALFKRIVRLDCAS